MPQAQERAVEQVIIEAYNSLSPWRSLSLHSKPKFPFDRTCIEHPSTLLEAIRFSLLPSSTKMARKPSGKRSSKSSTSSGSNTIPGTASFRFTPQPEPRRVDPSPEVCSQPADSNPSPRLLLDTTWSSIEILSPPYAPDSNDTWERGLERPNQHDTLGFSLPEYLHQQWHVEDIPSITGQYFNPFSALSRDLSGDVIGQEMRTTAQEAGGDPSSSISPLPTNHGPPYTWPSNDMNTGFRLTPGPFVSLDRSLAPDADYIPPHTASPDPLSSLSPFSYALSGHGCYQCDRCLKVFRQPCQLRCFCSPLTAPCRLTDLQDAQEDTR